MNNSRLVPSRIKTLLNGAGVGLCLLALSGCAVGPHITRLSPISESQSARRIAVLPFESSNPYLPGTLFSDVFTVQILQTGSALNVIERKDLMKILQEQKLTLTGVIRPEKFSSLGSILGVDAILIGSVQTLETLQSVGGAIAVTIKLMDVASGRVIWADRIKMSHATWSVQEVPEVAEILMEKTAKKMVDRMGRGLSTQAFSSTAQAIDEAGQKAAYLRTAMR